MLFLALLTVGNGLYVTKENVRDKMRLLNHVMVMTDDVFAIHNKDRCLERMVCVLETPQGIADDDNPWKYFSRFFTNTHQDFDSVAEQEFTSVIRRLPQVKKIQDAILLGQIQNDSRACHVAFDTCPVSDAVLVSVAKGEELQQQSNGLSKKDVCGTIDTTCDVVDTACTVCEVITVGVCGVACEPVGAVCKVAHYGCPLVDLVTSFFG